jgi:hypothetical protein
MGDCFPNFKFLGVLPVLAEEVALIAQWSSAPDDGVLQQEEYGLGIGFAVENGGKLSSHKLDAVNWGDGGLVDCPDVEGLVGADGVELRRL